MVYILKYGGVELKITIMSSGTIVGMHWSVSLELHKAYARAASLTLKIYNLD